MSTVSNRFYVTAIDDGTTLHGALQSTKPLSQAWTGSAAVPDWTNADNRPVIYLTLMEGSSYVVPESGYKWKYNGVEIDFSQGVFEKVTYIPQGYSSAVPAIRINQNLASSENVDVDIISFEGSYEMAGAQVGFSASATIRITTVTSGGLFGIIEFDGEKNITVKGQQIRMFGTLFDGSGNEITSGYTAAFYLNDESHLIKTTTPLDRYAVVNEGDIVDSAVIICKFTYSENGQTYTAYDTIDDQQDPEFMYIQYNGANGNAASLKKGESVTFSIWMGQANNPAIEDGWMFKLKVLDAEGLLSNAQFDDLPNADNDGWRALTVSSGKASVQVSYDTAKALGKYMTGLILAEK